MYSPKLCKAGLVIKDLKIDLIEGKMREFCKVGPVIEDLEIDLIEERMRDEVRAFKASPQVIVSNDLLLAKAIKRIDTLEKKQEEMLRLHAAMYDLVRDLTTVVSTNVSHNSLLSPQPLLPPLHLPTKQEPLHLPTKEDDSHNFYT